MAEGTINAVRGMNDVVRLNNTADLDDITVPGLYFWDSSTPTHAPSTYSSMIVNKATNSRLTFQLVWTSAYIYYRTYSPGQGKWNNWRRLEGSEIS